MGSSMVAGLLVAGALAAVNATPATATDTSVLHKSVRDVTHPDASVAEHGDTLDWVIDYAGNGTAGPAPATVTDPIAGASSAQTYVPGSLKVPPGWAPSWSQDGSTFVDTDQGTATAAVRASSPTARPGGTNLDRALLPPVQAVTSATGGDGFTPFIYREGDRVEAWNTFHHNNAPAASLVCTDLTTGHACSGGPWPKPLNTTPGPFGSGATSDISTTLTEQYVFDPDRPGVVYYPGLTSGSVGVGCLDLAARASCGFFPLVDRGGSPSSVNGLAGLVASDGDLFGVATTGQVLCLSMASRTPCAGQPYAPVVPPNNDQPGVGHNDFLGAMAAGDGRIFVSSSPNASSTGVHPPVLGCFDPATHDACAGWATPHTIGAAGTYTYNAFLAYDTGGHPDGVCSTITSGGPPQATCYAFDGSALAPPSGFGSLPAGVLSFTPETFAVTGGHVHSYFGLWGGSVPGATVCYDWTAAAMCAGFPALDTHPGVNGGATRDYGYAHDATNDCMYALGDAGVLFSIDPASGKTPCLHTGTTVSVNTASFYCGGGTGHVQGYEDARLENIDMANVDLAASSVDVTDADGTPIAVPGLSPDGTVDLSGVSVADHPSISANAHLVLKNGNDFTTTNHPDVVVIFRGDPPQICFSTKVGDACTVTNVSNTATGSDVTGDLTSNAVNLLVAPGSGCQPHVSVEKEICASAFASKCGPTGSGPWAKQTPVGLLSLLGTAYWRISVTNTGPVDAASVRLDDATEPSCEQAAGTFELAANQTKRFYCSTFLLLLPLKNTVTASFVAANSPPGTQRTSTKPSSAVACGLLCILVQ
jgi:hypothetical protein